MHVKYSFDPGLKKTHNKFKFVNPILEFLHLLHMLHQKALQEKAVKLHL